MSDISCTININPLPIHNILTRFATPVTVLSAQLQISIHREIIILEHTNILSKQILANPRIRELVTRNN